MKTGEGIIVEPIGWKTGHFTLGVKKLLQLSKEWRGKKKSWILVDLLEIGNVSKSKIKIKIFSANKNKSSWCDFNEFDCTLNKDEESAYTFS